MIREVKHMKTHDIVRENEEHWLQKNKKFCQYPEIILREITEEQTEELSH